MKKLEKLIVKDKDMARQVAIDYQRWASEQSLSYGDIAFYTDYFTKLGRKFGLLKEFKENGII